MKKKLLLIVVPLIFIICFSSTASALMTEERAGIDRGGLHSYIQWFDDFSGVLVVTTTHVNNSGVSAADVTITAACVNESRNFRLRIYDSDTKEFFNIDNENGIGVKERNIQVRVHMDSENLLWSVFVTDMTGKIVFAEIYMLYIYDEDADYIPPGEDPDTVSKEEHEKAVKQAKLESRIVSGIMAFLGVVVAIGYIRRMK